jgi:hypothetical protein
MEAGEVAAFRRHQGQQTLEQLGGCQDEGGPSLGAVGVAPVLTDGESLFSDRATAAIPAQAFQALSVMGVHRCVGVQAKALQHGQADMPGRLFRV